MNINQSKPKVEILLAKVYEKYKHSFNDEDKESCEMYLYEQGEYEEALSMLLAALQYNEISIDHESRDTINEVCQLIGIDRG